MQLLGRILAYIFSPLAALTSALTPFIASFAHRTPTQGDFALAAVVVSAGLITIVCSFWAAGEHVRFVHLRQSARDDAARARSTLMFRDTVLGASGQPIVVMGVDMSAPLSFSGGNELLKSCLSGPDATKVATALDALLECGMAFEESVIISDHRTVVMRGTTIGGKVALFFQVERKIADLDLDGRGVLDALPIPVWVRSKDLSLRWVNQAFLAATGSPSFEKALESNMAFDRTEHDLSATARDDGTIVEAKRYAVIAGQRRALTLMLQPAGAGVAGAAVDVTDVAQSEIKLQSRIEGLHDILDRFDTAVAAFGADHRLVTFNRAYAELWDLPEKWLNANPTDAEILDRLREGRQLPEQRDFATWKRSQIELFDKLEGAHEDFWHLPGGTSLRIVAQRNAFGGLTFRIADVSEKLRLESSYNTLMKVQKATLDTLDDGVAIIGPDGRIKTYNNAFAQLWHLMDSELATQPHIKRIAELCATRIGRDQTWEIVASGIAAARPERLNDWGKIGRSDGRAISLSLSRLPDGSTLATFSDLTEAMHFEQVLQEQATFAA